MQAQIRFMLSRIKEKLWVKPLFICLLSIAAAFLAQVTDQMGLFPKAPEVTSESIKMLLSTISSSMLVIAVFAVGAMLSSYQSASSAATPRAFTLVLADDVSQNALSTFIGAFIFSIVAQVALTNGYYERAGRLTLFVMTIFVFALVIFSFIRWVDRIARLGRLDTIIKKTEDATEKALCRHLNKPTLGALKAEGRIDGVAIYAQTIGYIQRIDVDAIQNIAKENDIFVEVASLPGKFAAPDKPVAYLRPPQIVLAEKVDTKAISKCFFIGSSRTFDEDPRFGFVVLSEIASRALSPGINDPGTAIRIVDAFVRLLSQCAQNSTQAEPKQVDFDRVAIPEISLSDMFDDAYNPVARDGAGTIEVVIKLQKSLSTLADLGSVTMKEAALGRANFVFAHAENALKVSEEIGKLRLASDFALHRESLS
ncbi:DUF2254 domain-containing protein [Candidatus Nitrotoga sp. M5]|uniref:DUF2254 domain-containing protein n=1 Tax=Candidatus Nitrotoga sp. M5 TaxID=2890409 RepID=UPI001EF1D31C|nr:DUF2254 domain-containing protein [Candidatus Nitrotoga sp. M5]CAH1386315.1 conserved membrane hypothetical protein [Candidatus Nitrotoga sp. M5]